MKITISYLKIHSYHSKNWLDKETEIYISYRFNYSINMLGKEESVTISIRSFGSLLRAVGERARAEEAQV